MCIRDREKWPVRGCPSGSARVTSHPEVGLFGVNLTRNAQPVLLKNSTRSRPQGRNADYTSSGFRDRRVTETTGRIVGVPSLWPRPGGVLQQHGLGVSRQVDSEQANFRVARDSG